MNNSTVELKPMISDKFPAIVGRNIKLKTMMTNVAKTFTYFNKN